MKNFTRTSKSVSELFEQHKKMILQQAWVFYKRNNGKIPIDELISEGTVIFMNAIRNYNSDKGIQFSTVLYTYLRNGMISFCSEWNKHMPETMEKLPEVICKNANADGILSYKEYVNSLSSEAREVVNLLTNDFDKLAGFIKNPKPRFIRIALQKYLHLELRWDESKIKTVFNELKCSVKV